jgi:signal transduction histidine kinase/EAL domain-containing protein (putative c-di-GMP-specific phosphodiesterase class I)
MRRGRSDRPKSDQERKVNSRIRTIVGVVLLVGLLTGAAVVFATSDGTRAIAEDAAVQIRVQELISSVDNTRAILSEALLFGVAFDRGELAETTFRAVVADAHAALVELDIRTRTALDLLADDAARVTPHISAYREAAAGILTQIEEGQLDEAQEIGLPDFVISYDQAVTALIAERGRIENNIAAVRNGVAGVADAARFMVAFFIPAAIVVGSLALASRRQRQHQMEAEYLQDQSLRSAKDEFLTAIAQELRTPLTGVVGFAETLRDRARDLTRDEREELVEIVAQEATNTAAVVEDLLVFARANVGDLVVRPQTITVRDVTEQVALSWGEIEHGRLKISGSGAAWADPIRLRQVMRNLLSNAFRHGGHTVEVRIAFDDEAVVIEVADNGPGIPLGLRHRVFEPYQHGVNHTSNPASIGLGLTVARTLVRLMDGDLTYSYADGESVFRLTLPAAVHEYETEEVTVPGLRLARLPSAAEVVDVINEQRFSIVYQPIFDLQHGDEMKMVGMEALARFPSGAPGDWFAAATAGGIGIDVELETIRSAVAGFMEAPHALFLALNTSLATLLSPRLLQALEGLVPGRVVLELSEETVVENYQRTVAHLSTLTGMGYRLAVDDLARGRIDLWHLVRLRPSIVKFDISLIREIDVDPGKRALVNALKWLGDVLRCKIVAEGMERTEELDTIRRLGIHYGQGNVLARPSTWPVALDLEPEPLVGQSL